MKPLIDLLLGQLVLPMFGLFATSPADLRGAVTDLGGGSDVGGEPEIFDGGDDADAGGGDGAGDGDGGESDEPAPGDDQGGDDTEGEGAGGEEPDQGGEPSDEEAAGEEEGEGAEAEPAEKTPEQLEAERVAAAAKKPLTEEEKEIEKTLQEAYRSNPKFKEAFAKYPELRAPFFKAAQINKIYPGGINEATRAKEWAQDLFKIDQLYYGSGPADMKSKREFLNFMYQESLDRDGKSTGHYEAIAELIGSDILGNVEAQLAQQPQLAAAISKELKPQQVSTAIEIVRRAVSLLSGKPMAAADPNRPQSAQPLDLGPNSADMTPRERQLAQENANYKAALAERAQTESAAAEQTFNKAIYDDFLKGIKPDIDSRMPAIVKSGTGRLQKWFVNDVLDELHNAMREDTFFDAQLRAVVRSGDRGQQHVQQLSEMMKQRAQTLLPTIARKVVAELQSKSQSSTNAQGRGNNPNRGNERPRREPVAGGSPGRLTRPSGRVQSPADKRSAVKSSGDYNRDANKLLGIE
jgi:hypothetical protein